MLPHIIGIHGLVLLAVPAVLLARTAMPRTRQLGVIALTVTSVTLATAILLTQALRQLPLDQLHPAALATLALCAIALLGAYANVAAVLASARRAGQVGGALGSSSRRGPGPCLPR